MDNLKERTEDIEREKSAAPKKRHSSKILSYRPSLVYELVFVCIGIIFSRCHIVFGARPLGVAYVSLLPVGVLPAALGAVLGALTLGRGGILYAVSAAIALLLRIVISGGGKERRELFSENLLLRISISIIAGFVGALYEILVSGLSQTSVLFGLSMILIPPFIVFLLSGIFSTGITVSNLVYDTGNIFSFAKKRDYEKYNAVFFQISAVSALFFISISLAEYEILGISVSYIFVSIMTLLVAKRFGALRALAVGFFSALGLSGVHAVGFSLAGLSAGVLFNFGTAFGIVGAIAAIAAWSSYSSGLIGFLSTMPEFVIATVLAIPVLRHLFSERSTEEADEAERTAADMVGTMALSFRGRHTHNLDTLESSLSALASVMRRDSPSRISLSHEEYKNLVCEVADRQCKSCPSLELCESESIHPCRKNAHALAEKLALGDKILPEDINTDTEFCQKAEEICSELAREAARAECDMFRMRESNAAAEEYELISKLISEARCADEGERSVNSALGDKISAALAEGGYSDWVIRVFGERRAHIILAGEDKDGTRIMAPELRETIEKGAGITLGAAEFFRKGDMALMECDSRRSYSVECASASSAADRCEVSGDTTSSFESDNGYFYALISDGMGRGEEARRASEFVSAFLSRALNFAASKDTVLHLLNRAMRKGKDECSATVDLFELDEYTGEATFIKSGSAPSYVKRESSIFRIKSQTAPIGLMSTIDTEKIRVEIKCGDVIVMLSDGISQSSDDAPWLLELLAKPIKKDDLAAYAEKILSLAKENSQSGDDMSVIVLRICESK